MHHVTSRLYKAKINFERRQRSCILGTLWTRGSVCVCVRARARARVCVSYPIIKNMYLEFHKTAKECTIQAMCAILKCVRWGERNMILWIRNASLRQRPYHVENTGSRLITATLGMVSTWMGDRLGTPCAVVILFTSSSFSLFVPTPISSLSYFENCKTGCNILKIVRQAVTFSSGITSESYLCNLIPKSMHLPLRTVRPIYRTGVPLPSRCCILYIFFQQI